MMIRTWHWWGSTIWAIISDRYRRLCIRGTRYWELWRSLTHGMWGDRGARKEPVMVRELLPLPLILAVLGPMDVHQKHNRREERGKVKGHNIMTALHVMLAYNKSGGVSSHKCCALLKLGGVSSHKCCALLHKSHKLWIEHFHVTSSPLRLRRKTENSRHVGV